MFCKAGVTLPFEPMLPCNNAEAQLGKAPPALPAKSLSSPARLVARRLCAGGERIHTTVKQQLSAPVLTGIWRLTSAFDLSKGVSMGRWRDCWGIGAFASKNLPERHCRDRRVVPDVK